MAVEKKKKNAKYFIEENAFENVICEMSIICIGLKVQSVKT